MKADNPLSGSNHHLGTLDTSEQPEQQQEPHSTSQQAPAGSTGEAKVATHSYSGTRRDSTAAALCPGLKKLPCSNSLLVVPLPACALLLVDRLGGTLGGAHLPGVMGSPASVACHAQQQHQLLLAIVQSPGC